RKAPVHVSNLHGLRGGLRPSRRSTRGYNPAPLRGGFAAALQEMRCEVGALPGSGCGLHRSASVSGQSIEEFMPYKCLQAAKRFAERARTLGLVGTTIDEATMVAFEGAI